MAHHKLLLDDDIKEEYTLIAIHCSEETYKVAYLLNKFLLLQLKREELDLDYSSDGLDVMFPLFEFKDEMQYTTYNLVANKCKSEVANLSSTGGLFSGLTAEKTIMTFLIPELKQVDFFLKIFSDFEIIPLRKIMSSINEIKQIISAYEVEVETIKSKNNLIFD